MEWTNLFIFGTLLAVVFFSGMAIVLADVTNNYPVFAANSPQLQNLTQSVNLTSSVVSLNTGLINSTGAAQQFTTSDSPLAVAFGYLLGAFQSVVNMVITLPQIFLNIITVLGTTMGIFFPSFLSAPIIVAALAVMLLGVLYYWLKVH